MPRRSSGGRPHAVARAPLRNPPQPVAPAPPPAPIQRGSIKGGLGSVVAEGMAFGVGSAIAHRTVDAVMGPRVVQHEVSSTPAIQAPASGDSDACGYQSKAFQDCLNHYGSDISKCQFYMDMLSECRRNSSAGLRA